MSVIIAANNLIFREDMLPSLSICGSPFLCSILFIMSIYVSCKLFVSYIAFYYKTRSAHTYANRVYILTYLVTIKLYQFRNFISCFLHRFFKFSKADICLFGCYIYFNLPFETNEYNILFFPEESPLPSVPHHTPWHIPLHIFLLHTLLHIPFAYCLTASLIAPRPSFFFVISHCF